ncbi:hypothetical protein niasHT_034305 [Heterodera trifolii]|uniref:Alpha-mannosidase n=1 Tax=Heterodera trifolii TaxID=157864 RepID=A0ABD2HWC5_9BILA
MESRNKKLLAFGIGTLLFLLFIGVAVIVLIFVPRKDDNSTPNGGEEKFCAWNNCPQWLTDNNSINVHLICHTHNDMGWKKTVDDYYTGANGQISNVGVRYILNTVVDELQKDPRRRFSYAETGFLTRWVEEMAPDRVEQLRKLVVEKGQLEFVGGGWTQPDEAATHYYELVDQYALGLGKLSEKYGVCGRPKVAWQIDPFGHSREHANLVSMMGYEALFFARMHYLERKFRIENKSLEMMWNTEDSGNNSLFTGAFASGTYSAPKGFCFDVLCDDDPMIDDPKLEGFNVEQKVNAFLEAAVEEAKTKRHNHVMFTMGGDFSYGSANRWFTNLDTLINAANERTNSTGIRLFYSTPSCYANAVRESIKISDSADEFPRKSDDFFPYASAAHSYWTGLFASKANFKGIVRKSSAFLQLVRSFKAIAASSPTLGSASEANLSANIEIFERAQALTTHHDAITGTAKEAVTQNYEQRLWKGWDIGEEILNEAFSLLATNSENADSNASDGLTLKFCRRINDSYCAESVDNKKFVIVVFNGNSKTYTGPIRVPINAPNARVLDRNNQHIIAQVIPTFVRPYQIPMRKFWPSKWELVFYAEIKGLGYEAFYVDTTLRQKRSNKRANSKEKNAQKTTPLKEGEQSNQISNQYISLTFGANGLLASFEDLIGQVKMDFSQKFAFYTGANGRRSAEGEAKQQQTSGAYVFRPNEKMANELKTAEVQFVKNDLVHEARQIVKPWLSQIVRLYMDKPFVEFEYLIGPLPKDQDNLTTMEIVTKYQMPSIKSNGIFWTDSNGRQMMQRRRNHNEWFSFESNSEPISANYYPIDSRLMIRDERTQMAILTDRSHGGTSLRDGEMELMLHRRSFWDDNWGVDEPLDEPGEDGRGLVVRAKHWLFFAGQPSAFAAHRQWAFEMFHQPILAFTSINGNWADFVHNYKTGFSVFGESLPQNVNLMTLKHLGNKQLLIRLEHIYQRGEAEEEQTEAATVNLKTLFKGIILNGAKEMGLAANVLINDATIDMENVALQPMQIRTFQLSIE